MSSPIRDATLSSSTPRSTRSSPAGPILTGVATETHGTKKGKKKRKDVVWTMIMAYKLISLSLQEDTDDCSHDTIEYRTLLKRYVRSRYDFVFLPILEELLIG